MRVPVDVNYDDILDEIGGFGKFQKRAMASLLVVQIFMAFANFGFVFFGYSPTQFHCADHSMNTTGCLSNCTHYISDDGYSSYTVEWDLICSRPYLIRFAQIAHMAGLFAGAFACGALADRFGRLRILYISLVVMCALSFLTIWLPDIYSFCVTTFLLGICCQGAGLTSYTLILEAVSENYRALCGILEQVFYAFGIALTAVIAFYVPNWRNLAAALASYGPLSFLCMLPFHIESTRWLLTKPNKREQALRNLKFIAMTNGTLRSRAATHGDGGNQTPILEKLLNPTNPSSSSEEESPEAEQNESEAGQSNPLISHTQQEPLGERFCVLCSHPLLRKWTFIFSICWFSNAAAYYGSTIASGEAFKNRFVSFALSGLIEIPGHCVSPWLMNRFGRRKFHAYLMIIGGVLFALVLPLDYWHEAAVIVIAILAKLCIAMSFASAYVYSSEVYPTSIVNAAVGFCVTAGRLGGTVAPAFLSLGRGPACLIFGVITLVSGLAALNLPETLGRHIPATSVQLSSMHST